MKKKLFIKECPYCNRQIHVICDVNNHIDTVRCAECVKNKIDKYIP